jgi:hypothetical protein
MGNQQQRHDGAGFRRRYGTGRALLEEKNTNTAISGYRSSRAYTLTGPEISGYPLILLLRFVTIWAVAVGLRSRAVLTVTLTVTEANSGEHGKTQDAGNRLR